MRNLSAFFMTAYKVIVANFFEAIVVSLAIIAAFFTSFIDIHEKTYFLGDSLWWNLISAAFFLVILFGIKKNRYVCRFLDEVEVNPVLFRKCRFRLLIILMGISVIWLLASQYTPGSDQAAIQNAVSELRTGDYSQLEADGYLAKNVHQLGLVLFFYILSFVIGSQNYIALQLLNAVAVVVVYHGLSAIGSHFGMKKKQQLGILAAGIFFFPLILYTSFIYGNLYGLALSVISTKKMLDFFKREKWMDAILSVLFMMMAVMIKTNSLIFMIGLIILISEEAIRKKKRIYFLIPVLLLAAFLIQTNGIRFYFEKVSGNTLEGSSYWGYVAMGLQDSESRAPGWYNGYVYDSYSESGCDAKVQGQIARDDIRQTLTYFKMHPGEAATFFFKKTASQWNNPTFQCYNIIQWRESGIERSDWVKWMVSPRGAHFGTLYLNILEFILLIGAAGYCILFWKEKELPFRLSLAVIFVGGFLFHLFWEAKGQYTISYFVLLIPYAVSSYSYIGDWMISRFEGQIMHKRRKMSLYEYRFLLPAAFIVIFLSMTLFTGEIAKELSSDAAGYYEILRGE